MYENVTLKLETSLLKKLRHIALDDDKSLSAWFANLAREKITKTAEYRAAMKRTMARKPLNLGGKPLSREEIYSR